MMNYYLKIISLFFISPYIVCTVSAQEFIPLWPKGQMPNSKGLEVRDSTVNERLYRISNPGIYTFFPSKDDNSGAAVMIFPGGGYSHITLNLSGFQLAKWFNSLGMSAFVVVYRLPNSPDLEQRELGPIQDARKALHIVKENAIKWGIQKDKIGVMGTSAGGHLASWVATTPNNISSINDSITIRSFLPAFMILISPVIDMGKYAQKGSRASLLGSNPAPEMIEKYSTQNSVTAHTPPCFMVHAFNDKGVLPQNSLLFYQALLEKKISTSFHVFPQGGHAININNNPGSTSLWKQLCEMWLIEMGFISFTKNQKNTLKKVVETD